MSTVSIPVSVDPVFWSRRIVIQEGHLGLLNLIFEIQLEPAVI